MKTAGRTLGSLAAVVTGLATFYVAMTAGQYAIPIWGSLAIITFASTMGAIWAQKAPGRAAILFLGTSVAWAWFGAKVFGQTLNIISTPFMVATVLAGLLLLWASVKAPSDDATAAQ